MRHPLAIEGNMAMLGPNEGYSSQRLYAVGDIHGQIQILDDLLAQIEDDLRRHPIDRGKLIFTGDYIDRGADARAVIDRVSRLQENRFHGAEVICLRGNHEQWMIDFISGEDNLANWGVKGGSETLQSYDVPLDDAELDLTDSATNARLRAILAEKMPVRHQHFLASLPLTHSHEGYFFVHAGVDPDRPLNDQRDHDLIWIRDKFLTHPLPFGKVVVHGHSCCAQVESHANRINIDTGIYIQGRLSCVILEGASRDLLQAVGEPCAGYAHHQGSLVTRKPLLEPAGV
ncbi:metallophosphoesterase family protein [Devosia sp. A369]